VQVIGVSFDSPEKNAIFKANEEFTFPLWSDEDKGLAMTYGAADSTWALFASRITVVLDPQGDWVLNYPADVVSAKSLYVHAQTLLDDLALLFAAP
jgi:peroxiredoxin